MLITIGAALLGLILFWGRVSPALFWCGEIALTAAGVLMARCAHSHGGMLAMDVCANRSRFLYWNAGGKLLFVLMMLFFSIGADSVAVGLTIFVIMAVLALAGGVRLHEYLSSLSLSVQFDGTLQDYLYQDLKSAGCRMVSVQCRYGHGCVVFTQTQDTMTIWEAAMDPACFYATLSTLAGRFGAKRVLLTAHPVYANSERELTPYGMYLPLEEKLSLSLEKHPHPYMNLMLDL